MTIDIHAHYFPVEYLDRLDRNSRGQQLTGHIRRSKVTSADLGDVQAHLAAMDRAGVDFQVLSVSSQFPYFADEGAAADAARFGNETYAAICRQAPARLAAFAVTPLPHVRASIEETRYALDELGMAGVTAGTAVLGKSIVDPSFDEFFAELDRRSAILFIHPTGGAAGSGIVESSKLTWPIGAPVEDTVCLLRMMDADFARRFPNVKVILPHLGGFGAFLTARLDQSKHHFLPESAAMPSEQARRYWYDTVNGYPPALRCARESLGSERLLLGSDYPFWRGDAFKLCVDYVRQSGLPEGEIERILGGNAADLLGSKISAQAGASAKV